MCLKVYCRTLAISRNYELTFQNAEHQAPDRYSTFHEASITIEIDSNAGGL